MEKISHEILRIWNLPYCVGATDGSHIAIKSPLKGGSLYYTYKEYFSMVLMAVCNAHYCFTLGDIGSYGSNNDSDIFRNSFMREKFFSGKVNLQLPASLENSPVSLNTPYFIVGNKAFLLQTWYMRPYSGNGIPEEKRIFNFRLPSTRRVLEKAFGILAARWRVTMRDTPSYSNTTQATQANIQATIVLHNILFQANSAAYCPAGFADSYGESGAFKPGESGSVIQPDG